MFITWFLNLTFLTQIILIYLVIINLITFFYFGIDKMRSIRNERRISERMLWFLSLIGGSAGALLGMNYFRHKTKKLSFQAGFAVILALQILLIYFLLT